MTAREELLSEIERFLSKHRMSPTAFGRLALNDTAFLGRLRKGADVRTETADKIRAFIAAYKPRSNPRKSLGNSIAA